MDEKTTQDNKRSVNLYTLIGLPQLSPRDVLPVAGTVTGAERIMLAQRIDQRFVLYSHT